MALLSYLIWNGSPEIFSLGSFSLRWYGLFFASGFLIGQQLMYYMYRKEGKPEKDVDTLTIYMVIATVLGARFGHVIFYQPELFWTDPLSIILPFEFKPFRFTGLQGLASHGAAIGIIFATWLLSRRRKPGQNFLQLLDRIVIIVALCGALIRLGNYFNSEIIGKPTDKPWAVVFAGPFTDYLQNKNVDTEGIVELVGYLKNDTVPKNVKGNVPITIYIFFKPGTSYSQINNFINGSVNHALSSKFTEFFDQEPLLQMPYETAKQSNGALAARMKTYAIPRHPAQMYECLSCVLLFSLLLWIWSRYKENLPAGRLFGIFVIICFSLRFLFEFLKENQEAFENSMPLNMGQILSIPLVLAGVVVLFLSFRKKSTENSEVETKN